MHSALFVFVVCRIRHCRHRHLYRLKIRFPTSLQALSSVITNALIYVLVYTAVIKYIVWYLRLPLISLTPSFLFCPFLTPSVVPCHSQSLPLSSRSFHLVLSPPSPFSITSVLSSFPSLTSHSTQNHACHHHPPSCPPARLVYLSYSWRRPSLLVSCTLLILLPSTPCVPSFIIFYLGKMYLLLSKYTDPRFCTRVVEIPVFVNYRKLHTFL